MTPKEKFELRRKNFIMNAPLEFGYLVTEYTFSSPEHSTSKQANGTVLSDKFEYRKGNVGIIIANTYHPVDYGFSIKFVDLISKESKLVGHVLKENQDIEQSYLRLESEKLKESLKTELKSSNQKYIKTTKATNWPKNIPWYIRLLDTLLFFIPKANPDYKSKMHLVEIWQIEFIKDIEDGQYYPWREIALGKNGEPVFAGPDKNNYGYWHDTNLRFEDFEDNSEQIDKEVFENNWKKSGVKALE